MPRATKAATPASKTPAKGAPPAHTKAPATKPARAKAAPKAQSASSSASSGDSGRSRGRRAPLDDFLVAQQAALLADRASYVERADLLKAEAQQLAEDMEPGDTQFDEESGEGDSLNVERERDLALSAQARSAVDEIDQALARIESGTYGACERCGSPIPKARLKALPHAALCVACKSGGLSRR